MDVKSLLPLLAMLSGGKGNAEKIDALSKMLDGEKPDITKVMSMMPAQKPRATGLKPICDFAGFDILGRLASYFTKKSSK